MDTWDLENRNVDLLDGLERLVLSERVVQHAQELEEHADLCVQHVAVQQLQHAPAVHQHRFRNSSWNVTNTLMSERVHKQHSTGHPD